MRIRRPARTPVPPPAESDVLLISASMGAGHDGAATEIRLRLEALGIRATQRDLLRAAPLGIGAAVRAVYVLELRRFPAAYDATYRVWHRVPWLREPLAALVTVLAGRRLRRWIAEAGPVAVVSTYPLATLALGRLRASGKITALVVNFVTDFGVHPLWVHPGVDLNLAVHEHAAAAAASGSGKVSVPCGPIVSERFAPGALPPRDESRRLLGVGPDETAVLIVAGSWGVGTLHETVEAVAERCGHVAVVVCGRDDRLRDELAAKSEARGWRSVVIGWTDDMPSLMSGCDALVENAGGLTAFEAMRAGVPVVSFLPIPGHGKENTAAMAAAGVSSLADGAGQLGDRLELLTRGGTVRSHQVARASGLFREDPAKLIARAAAVAAVADPA